MSKPMTGKEMQGKAISIQINEKEYYVLFDFNTIAELQDLYGDIETAFARVQEGKLKAIRDSLWASLLHNDAFSLGRYELGQLMTEDNIGIWGEAITKAMQAYLPDESDNEVHDEKN